MARPKVKTGKPIMLYLTEGERETLERAALASGTSLSAYCRHAAMVAAVGGAHKKPAKTGRKGT